MPLPIVRETAEVIEAVRAIDAGGVQIVFVVDGEARLVGSISDGDVRRGLLRGATLQSPATTVMNPAPISVSADATRDEALELMRDRGVRQMAVVDSEGRLVAVELREHSSPSENRTLVVLMAGGLGSRLRPLTNDLPKPMLPVGGRPLMETIVRELVSQGFRRFAISVNYKAEIVKAHFDDGRQFGAEIEYLEEDLPLGTAGALSLMKERPEGPFLAMNADILTAIDCRRLLAFHECHDVDATVCVREYSHQVPFGVVHADDWRFRSIEEKPVQRWSVSAGIYALSPSALDWIPKGERFDMPMLFDRINQEGRQAAVFPLHEYWMDVGRLDDLDRARQDYPDVFGC